MSGRKTTADRLLGQIYLWIFNAQQFALVLKTLATELEVAPKQGGGFSVGQIIGLGLLTGPFRHLYASGGIAPSTYVIAKSELEKNKKNVQKCEKIKQKVEQLKEELISESESKNPNNVEQHVLFELLKSLGKTDGLTDLSSTGAMEQLMTDFLKKRLEFKVFQDTMTHLFGVLQFFNIKVLDATHPTAAKQDAMVGLGFSLPEAFDNCKKALENNNGAEAVKTLRNYSDLILKATKKLSEMIYEAQSLLAKAVQSQRGRSGIQWDQSEWRQAYEGTVVSSFRRLQAKEDNSEDEGSDEEETRQNGKKLRLALLNVRSIKKKAIIKGNVIRNLILNHNLDFFLITETWLQPGPEGDETLRSLLPPNRNFIHQPRCTGRGGGVAIVYSDSDQFTWCPVTLPEIGSFECVSGSVRHESWDRPILIITIYHPPITNLGMFNNFILEFMMLVDTLSSEYSSIIVAGDFNIWVDDESRRPTRVFCETLAQCQLDQFVQEPTHERGHTLDLVLGREMDVTDVIVDNEDISDHCMICFEARPRRNEKREEKKRQYKHDEL